MKIIDPLQIVPSMVVSSVTETNPTWSGSTTYSIGNLVIYLDRTYESLINTNLNKQPDTNPTSWLDVGPSNKMAAFDRTISTPSSGTGPLVMDITPNSTVTSIAIIGLNLAQQLIVEVEDPSEGVVYSKTIQLDGSIITSWFDYFFEEFDQLRDIVLTDIPPYKNATTTITVVGSTSCSVSEVILGTVFDIGSTQYGVSFGIRDYSIKEEDDYGNIKFVQRNYARRVEPMVMIENTSLRKIDRLLTSIRAKPTVFIPTEAEGYDPLITYGFLSDWNIEIPYPTSSLLRLDIKGLT